VNPAINLRFDDLFDWTPQCLASPMTEFLTVPLDEVLEVVRRTVAHSG
jgi:hypothetical protein